MYLSRPSASGRKLLPVLFRYLTYVDMPTLGQPEAFIQAKEGLIDSAGNIGLDSKQFLQSWMDGYVA